MSKYILVIGILLAALSALFLMNKNTQTQSTPTPNGGIRYVAIGDSYTIGEGASPDTAWPSLLVKHLRRKGIAITLVANPAATGFTTQDALEIELPIYDAENPTFATLQIGANDYVHGVDKETYRKRINQLIDRMQAKIPDQTHIILVTIPDFSVTPVGYQFGIGQNMAEGIQEFNEVLKEEGAQRKLPVVDIFPLSQEMRNNPDLISEDGLHPSAKEYALWEERVFESAYSMLANPD